MIYALLAKPTPKDVREEIARAILARQNVATFVQSQQIIHVESAHRGTTYFCIYCHDIVRPTKKNRPPDVVPADDWYFEHTTENRCAGTDFGLGNGLTNLIAQGCYILIKYETNGKNQPSQWHRECCKTINQGQSYCHLATQKNCV